MTIVGRRQGSPSPTARRARGVTPCPAALSRLREREGPNERRTAAVGGRVRVARKKRLARNGSHDSVGLIMVKVRHSLTLPPHAAEERRAAGPSLSRERARERGISRGAAIVCSNATALVGNPWRVAARDPILIGTNGGWHESRGKA